MRISELEHSQPGQVLIDSGATHALRPARDFDEWQKAERTVVTLADGTTTRFRLKHGTKILLSEPGQQEAWIVPMSGLTQLDFTLQWRGDQCLVKDDEGREIQVQIQQGCPMMSLDDGLKVLLWLEGFQVHQLRKMAMVRTFLKNPEEVDPTKLDLELALTVKLQHLFPNLPEEIMAKLVPRLESVNMHNFGEKVPWNRRKRRRLSRAKHVILHVFSGDNPQYWERALSTSTTEVLCVDLLDGHRANMLDRHTYGFLLMIAASGRLRVTFGRSPMPNHLCAEEPR